MALEVQHRTLELLATAVDGEVKDGPTPSWLLRPGRVECAEMWPLVQRIYDALTGMALPDTMPNRERRTIDAVLVHPDGGRRLVEIDERQHFTMPRATVLAMYPPEVQTAFPKEVWEEHARASRKPPGGGFARPCPPLFPEPGGRHLQRAFRDALADLLPSVHGWRPTLRVADFEVKGWFNDPGAEEQMRALVTERITPQGPAV